MILTAKIIKQSGWIKYKGFHISFGQNRFYISSLYKTHICSNFKELREYIKNFNN